MAWKAAFGPRTPAVFTRSSPRAKRRRRCDRGTQIRRASVPPTVPASARGDVVSDVALTIPDAFVERLADALVEPVTEALAVRLADQFTRSPWLDAKGAAQHLACPESR